MIHSTAVRLGIVALLVVATYGVAWLVSAGLELAEVILPDWTFEKMPLELGPWRGQAQELDKDVTVATGACPGTVVNRVYQDNAGHAISMHTAMFNNPRDGVYHTPINCYRANGWHKISEKREKLALSDALTLPVNLSTWIREGSGERVLVVYWYQLGEHVLFSRLDLGLKVRWSLRGREKWPALIKVMLEIAAPNAEEAKPVILDFAKQVAIWENQPRHRRQMLGETGETKGLEREESDNQK